MKIDKIDKTGESIKKYFQAFLAITLSNINVQPLNMPHFKGLGMRKLQYEIRICQKIIIKAQWHQIFCASFHESDFIKENNNDKMNFDFIPFCGNHIILKLPWQLLRLNAAGRPTVAQNRKNPPKITLENSWNWLVILKLSTV